MEQFRKIDMLLNHMSNNDPKIKEELMDFLIGVNANRRQILNIVIGIQAGKTTFTKYMTKVNKKRKFIPNIIIDDELIYMADEDNNKHIKDLYTVLPYYRNVLIFTQKPIKDYVPDLYKDQDYLKTIYVKDNVLTLTKKHYCFTGLLCELQNEDNNTVDDFAKYLDDEFEKRTNRKISETQSTLRYVEEFDYFLPTIATIFHVNEICIGNMIFDQHIKYYDLTDLLKENTEK